MRKAGLMRTRVVPARCRRGDPTAHSGMRPGASYTADGEDLTTFSPQTTCVGVPAGWGALEGRL